MPPESSQYLRTTAGVEPHDSYPPDFFSILDSLAVDSNPDYMPLFEASCLPHVDIFATKVPQLQAPVIVPDSVLSGLGSNGPPRFTSPYPEDHPLSESQVKSYVTKASNGFTLSQGSKLVIEDDYDGTNYANSPSRSDYSSGKHRPFRTDIICSVFNEDAVSQCTSSVNGWAGVVDFVAMEF